MASQSVTVRTIQGPVTVTVHDIQEYIIGLAQTSTKPASDPYTAHGPSGAVVGTLTSAQLRAAMSGLGYSKQQINNVMSGNVGGGGWVSDALQGLAGGLAAVGPAGSGLGDALDLIPGISSGAADAVAPAAEAAAGATAAETAAGSGLGSTLANLLSKYGSSAGSALIWAPIVAWLTTGKNWVRVLEYIGGAAMIAIAFREMARS